jgi:hypothetical protein
MAKMDLSFNFGANVKPKKPKAGKGRRRKGRKSDAWTAYVGRGKRRR